MITAVAISSTGMAIRPARQEYLVAIANGHNDPFALTYWNVDCGTYLQLA